MSTDEDQFAWWSRLRHSGLLLSPVVQIEKYGEAPEAPQWYQHDKLRTAHTRYVASIDNTKDRPQLSHSEILTWVDFVVEKYIGHTDQRLGRSHSIPESLTAIFRSGSRTESLKPDRVLFAEDGKTPLLLIKADSSPHIGRGKGRTEYARFLELLRGTGHRLGLLTNGLQFRLIYAGLDFESWCEWESERWFEDAEGAEELLGLRDLLFPTQTKDNKDQVIAAGLPGLLSAVEESRKRQADLSQVLRENVRQAVEYLLEDVSSASRTDPNLFHALVSLEGSDSKLTDQEAQEALLQATVRIVMRMVVCLFAESRGLLPVNDLIYSQSYGVRTLYELLETTTRHEGSQASLMQRHTAWARLMALFRLIYSGSSHGSFPLRPYGGALFRPGAANDTDSVSRALYILEHKIQVSDATIYRILKKLLRGPLPIMKGRSKTYVEGPVDYTDLRTEFIGLIYEGLLDYRLKRVAEETGPQVFLNLGRQPVLPLSRLESMLEENPKSLTELFTKLKKEKVTATVESDDEEETEDETEDNEDASSDEEIQSEKELEESHNQGHLDALHSARKWARQALVATKLTPKQRNKETDSEYDKRIEASIDELIDRVIAPGEFYLVRAGNTRKGTGTFYTRPQLAVPTVHRTLEPLCYDKNEDGTLTPKTPEIILGLKVCDPACGSASFLVGALHYLTDALFRALCVHCNLDDPKHAAKITLPFGRRRSKQKNEEVLPFLPNDPDRGDQFNDWVIARLRRHVVERCIYGVDINALAVEFARVSLWIETLNRNLPFSFLDHKIKVGNSLVGCWLDQVADYPIKAWEREGGDGKKGVRTNRIEHLLKGEKIGNRRSGEGKIKRELRDWVKEEFCSESMLFSNNSEENPRTILSKACGEYMSIHQLPLGDPGSHQKLYEDSILGDHDIDRLRKSMNEWCAIWFWPTDQESLSLVPTPLTFHSPNKQKESITQKIANELKFFHWELEFPDVFVEQKQGFDAIIGNPPWENSQPNPHEFFSDHEPLIRTMGRLDLLRRQKELFAEFPDIEDEWLRYCGNFKAFSNWVANISDAFGLSNSSTNPLGRISGSKELLSAWRKRRGNVTTLLPFRYQTGRVFTYKLFLEHSFFLLKNDGRLGVIVPSGLYSDSWSQPLRSIFLQQARWDWIFGYINWEKIFNIYYRFKFAICIIQRSLPRKSESINSCFGLYHIASWENAESIAFPLPRENVTTFSPQSLSILEISNQRDLEICEKVYANSVRVGEESSNWQIKFELEYMMNTDAKKFPPKEKWGREYEEDGFGRWVKNSHDVALPLYEGRMIGQYDFSQKGWVSGKGRSAIWRNIPFNSKTIEPQYLMSQDTHGKAKGGIKLAYMDIASSTNARTMVATIILDYPCGNSAPVLRVQGGLLRYLALTSILNSLSFDYVIRQRVSGLHLNWFILEECPIPDTEISSTNLIRIIQNSSSLSLIHPCFAVQWLELQRNGISNLRDGEWKQCWSVTVENRLRALLEVEALVAQLYGLTQDDFEWMLREDPSDPKGFWRVEKELPYEERFTGLAAKAFRALKEGKWSAETASELSNDEFFEILGIPELTNPQAAKAKGLPEPLIKKRKGCHQWQPENFPQDDPRHGWTWEDCRKDAIALLGSEEALEEYLNQATNPTSAPEDEEEFKLTSGRDKDPQKRLF